MFINHHLMNMSLQPINNSENNHAKINKGFAYYQSISIQSAPN